MPETQHLQPIQVGKGHRREMGNLRAVADSINQIGLLHPVVIDSRTRLIASQRRREAVKLLGWRTVPVRVVGRENIAEGEFVGHSCRKDFLRSEMAAIARVLRPREEERARRRHKSRLKQGGKAPVQDNCRNGEGGTSRWPGRG